MPTPESILLVDDTPRDTEMALHPLRRSNLAPKALALCDDAETPGYKFRCSSFAGSTRNPPVGISLDGGPRQGKA